MDLESSQPFLMVTALIRVVLKLDFGSLQLAAVRKEEADFVMSHLVEMVRAINMDKRNVQRLKDAKSDG